VLVGSSDLEDWRVGRTKPVSRISVKRIVQYEPDPIHHRFSDGTPINDLALLELQERPGAKVCYDLMALQYPNQDILSKPGKKVWVAGWGLAEDGMDVTKIRHADLEIVDTPTCNGPHREAITAYVSNRHFFALDYMGVPHKDIDDAWGRIRGKARDPVDSSMICAGPAPGSRKDACSGDSGGPLAVDVNGRLIQVGVVSWGRGCGNPEFKGVYARLGDDRVWNWLKKNIGHEPGGSTNLPEGCSAGAAPR
jgi:hypothetical protein